MPRRNKFGIGIDVGSHGVQLAVLRPKKGGYVVDRVASKELPHDSIVDGTVMDARVVCDSISELLKENHLRGKEVALSVAGRRVMIKRIATDEMSDDELKAAIMYEAKSNLPFDVSELSFDYAKLSQDSEAGRMDVLLVAAKHERVFDAVEPVRWAGARPLLLEAEPFALQAAMTEAGYLDENQVVAALHVGFQSTDIIVFERGEFDSNRSLNIGGKTYVEGLIRSLGVTFERAAAILAKGSRSDEERDALAQVARNVAEKLVEQTERAMPSHFGGMADRPIDKIVLCGGGALLPELQAAIRARFGVEVEICNPFRNLEMADSAPGNSQLATAPEYTAAVGLALRALGDPYSGFNLLMTSDRPEARRANYAGASTIIPVLVISASLLVMVMSHIMQESKLAGLRGRLEKVQSETDIYRDKIALVEDLTAKRADIAARIDVIQDLDKNRFARIKLLQLLNNTVPELTWITGLSETQTSRGPGFNLSGVTSSNLKVSQLMSNLLKDPTVKGVDLQVSEQGTIADINVTNFTLQAGFPVLGLIQRAPNRPENLLKKGAAALKEKRQAEEKLKKEASK